MISQADFDWWLKDPRKKRVILYEQDFAYESAGAPAIGTMYFGSKSYITGPAQTPANRRYRDCIQSIAPYSCSIDLATFGGQVQISVGNVELANGDSQLDYMLSKVVDGRDARFYIGDKSWDRSDFRLFLVAVAERIEAPPGSKIIRVALRDRGLLLDASINGAVIPSGADAGKFKPLIFGDVRNLEPKVKDATTLEYWVSSDVAQRIYDVRDSGVSLKSGGFSADNAAFTANAGTDTMTYAGHGLAADDVIRFEGPFEFVPAADIFAGIDSTLQFWVLAAGLTANDFRVSLTRGGAVVNITGTTFAGTVNVRRRRWYDSVAVDGSMMLSSAPTGRLTCDVRQAALSLQTLAARFSSLPASAIDAAAFAAYEIAKATKGGSVYVAGLVVYDRQNTADVMAYVARSSWGWFGPTNVGTLTAGLVDPPGIVGATATRTLTNDDLDDGIAVSNLPVTLSSASVLAIKNWVVQADGLAASVSIVDRAKYSRPSQKQGNSTAPTGTGYSTNWQGFHKTAVQGEPIDSVATEGFDGVGLYDFNAMANAFLADRKPHLQVAYCTTGLESIFWGLGEIVKVTSPRYGYAAGLNTRLLSITVDPLGERVQLTLLRQFTPDITTSDNP